MTFRRILILVALIHVPGPATSVLADEAPKSLETAIEKVKNAGVRVDLIEVGLNTPPIPIPPMGSPEPSAPASDSLIPGTLAKLVVDLNNEEKRIREVFQRQHQSTANLGNETLDRIDRNYPAIIGALTTLCCHKNPSGIPAETIRRILEDTGVDSGTTASPSSVGATKSPGP